MATRRRRVSMLALWFVSLAGVVGSVVFSQTPRSDLSRPDATRQNLLWEILERWGESTCPSRGR